MELEEEHKPNEANVYFEETPLVPKLSLFSIRKVAGQLFLHFVYIF